MIYLIHFNRKLHHAGHYLGFADSLVTLKQRLNRHRNGNGAKLIAAINKAGIAWILARIWRGEGASRTEERRMKNMGGLSRLCPICNPGTRRRNNRVLEEKNDSD